VIGYYVHHQGRGHLHRAMAIARALGSTVVVGLSSLPRPEGWPGPWIELPRDDDGETRVDAEARGRLHWVPERHAGLRARMAEISSWIDDVDPELMVVDVSVEVSLLARLHGVPVITIVLPGDRRDAAHELVHSVARRIVAAWPSQVRQLVRGVEESDRLVCVGAMSRFDGRERGPGPLGDGTRRVVVLSGAGGSTVTPDAIESARGQSPGWEWTVLGGPGAWVDDPWDVLCAADVIVTHAGQNAIAEVAAAGRPAVVVPQPRPFDEQDLMATGLAASARWPAIVRGAFPTTGWSDLLDAAACLDGDDWTGWNDGQGAARAAAVVQCELRAVAGRDR